MSAALETELVRLESLDLEGLRAEWRRRYGAPPKLRSPELVRRIIAWRIQAQAFGGLDPNARQALRRGGGMRATLGAGVRLGREWNGVVHEVDVIEGGFRYREQTYRSLSQVARTITGVNWNGPRFFGLRKSA